MQHFRSFSEYLDELTEYGTVTYAKCLDDMAKLMIERGVVAVVMILAKVKAPTSLV